MTGGFAWAGSPAPAMPMSLTGAAWFGGNNGVVSHVNSDRNFLRLAVLKPAWNPAHAGLAMKFEACPVSTGTA